MTIPGITRVFAVMLASISTQALSGEESDVQKFLGKTVHALISDKLEDSSDISVNVSRSAMNWFGIVLNEQWRPPVSTKPQYSNPKQKRIDVVGFEYLVDGTQVAARQTQCAWGIALTLTKDNEPFEDALGMAKKVIHGFDGEFILKKECKNASIYEHEAPADRRRSDWTNRVLVVLEKNRIVFVGLKKQPQHQLASSFFEEDNISWFSSVDGTKETSR